MWGTQLDSCSGAVAVGGVALPDELYPQFGCAGFGQEYQAGNKQFEESQGRTGSLCFFWVVLQAQRNRKALSDSGYQSARDVLSLHPGKCLVKGISASLTWLLF